MYNHLIGEENENFYLRVAEHKDIKKVVIVLKTAASSMKGQVTEVLQQFSHYSVIWKEDKNLKVKVCFPVNTFSCLTFRQIDTALLFIHFLGETLDFLK